ncbi:hypothetical protein RCC89_05400 [Cytophagaceae bacterium ABcell3]|nr:hypothetical protein RCC89_05400 [Cytophagaceae bacterium ABcell3]
MHKYIIFFFCILTLEASAQMNPVTLDGLDDQAFQRNDILISPGVSFAYFRGESFDHSREHGSLPPASINVDYGITDFLSAGILGGWNQRLYTHIPTDQEYAIDNIIFGVRSSFHYLHLLEKLHDSNLHSDRLDLYISISGAYRTRDVTVIDLEEEPSPYLIGATAGARYYFYRGFGLFAEGGYGIFGYGTVGLQFRL